MHAIVPSPPAAGGRRADLGGSASSKITSPRSQMSASRASRALTPQYPPKALPPHTMSSLHASPLATSQSPFDPDIVNAPSSGYATFPKPPPGRMRLHNSDMFIELMQGADWSKTDDKERKKWAEEEERRKKAVERRRAEMGTHLRPKLLSTDPNAALTHEKQREFILQKKQAREADFTMKFEQAKKDAERRTRERQTQRDRQFERRFNKFLDDGAQIVSEVSATVSEHTNARERKKERLYNEWVENVFNPVQKQINKQVDALSATEVSKKREAMFNKFLTESNKKNGLFRDIIIEADYDPLKDVKDARVTYKQVSLRDDPTKNRLTRDAQSEVVVADDKLLSEMKGKPKARSALPVTMWDKVWATPFGRYSTTDGSVKIKQPTSASSKATFKSTIKIDHYNVLSGEDALKKMREEGDYKGTRKTEPPSELKEVFQPGSTNIPMKPLRFRVT